MILDDPCLRDYFHNPEIPETPFQLLGSRVSWRLLARVSQPFCIETFWCLGVMFREHVIPSDSGKLHMSVLHGLRGVSYAAHLIYVLFSMRNSAKHLVIRQLTRPLTRADLFSESGSASKKSLQL
jgi:hypothetical protein